MTAYLVVEVTVEDAKTYERYIERIPRVVYRYSGRYLARGDAIALSRDWTPDRVILLEFDSLDAIASFTTSPEYGALAPLRESSTRTRAIALPGVEAQPS